MLNIMSNCDERRSHSWNILFDVIYLFICLTQSWIWGKLFVFHQLIIAFHLCRDIHLKIQLKKQSGCVYLDRTKWKIITLTFKLWHLVVVRTKRRKNISSGVIIAMFFIIIFIVYVVSAPRINGGKFNQKTHSSETSSCKLVPQTFWSVRCHWTRLPSMENRQQTTQTNNTQFVLQICARLFVPWHFWVESHQAAATGLVM